MNTQPTYLELLEARVIPNKQKDVQIRLGKSTIQDGPTNIAQVELADLQPNTPVRLNIADKQKDFTGNRQDILNKLQQMGKCVVMQKQVLAQDVPISTTITVVQPPAAIPVKTVKKVKLADKPVSVIPEMVLEMEQLPDVDAENVEQDALDEVTTPTEIVEQVIIEKKKRGRKAKTTTDAQANELPVDLTTAVIRTQKVIDRLPKEREKNIIVAPPYYMNNRKLFIQKMAALFEPRRKELLENKENISCDRSQSTGFDLLTHQKIVRDYLNLYTPYRGLLLYHGLGSGKTCTSIAIAEGMKTNKQIYVMTPASLKMNFFSEMKKCGEDLYKKNQYWEFVPIEGNPEYVGILARALSISSQTIRDNGGAWLVNVNKPANFSELPTDNQNAIDTQLNEMIRAKYKDINYNAPNLAKIISQISNDMTINPFDNSVIIIDEAHNLVSRIVNKMKSPKSISYVLYDLLMKANNARVVLLSGTPIINYPNEIGILYNILRGYIKTWTITINVTTNEKINTETILNILDKANIRTHDYVQYSGNKLVITRNPYGFINIKKRGALKGNTRGAPGSKPTANTTRKANKRGGAGDAFDRYDGVKLDDSGNLSDNDFIDIVVGALKKASLDVSEGTIELKRNKALPDDSVTFLKTFVDTEHGDAREINLFQRRILGLTSYFRSAQENLLPDYLPTESGDIYHVIKSEMTPYQFSVYARIRKDEADREKNAKKQQRKNQGDELFAISSTYRIFSRAACNFVFPEGIVRPIPNAAETVDENVLDLTIDPLNEGEEEKENSPSDKDTKTYAQLIEQALVKISEVNPETNQSTYLTGERLQTLSPKFYNILENIANVDNRGLHLLYSHFRTIEGIGLMKLILLANGFAEFKLQREKDSWTLVEDEKDRGKPTFVLYTGTETAEEKEIIRNVYNGDWDIVPVAIVDKIKTRAENNNFGEVIKVFMITSSGAEGINLKNTRYVHIVEPYWHMVRVEQVVGRARRICSHQALPEELRTVKVFLYITTFSNEQKEDEKNIELRMRDVSRLDKETPVTTDETLYEIASVKQRINNQILQAVKETAIDCSLYSKMSTSAKEKPMVCYGYGKVESNAFGSYPTFEMDREQKVGLDVKSTEWDIKAVTISGTKYALRTDTNGLYEFDSYTLALANPGLEPEYIGQLVNENGRYRIVPA